MILSKSKVVSVNLFLFVYVVVLICPREELELENCQEGIMFAYQLLLV